MSAYHQELMYENYRGYGIFICDNGVYWDYGKKYLMYVEDAKEEIDAYIKTNFPEDEEE